MLLYVVLQACIAHPEGRPLVETYIHSHLIVPHIDTYMRHHVLEPEQSIQVYTNQSIYALYNGN